MDGRDTHEKLELQKEPGALTVTPNIGDFKIYTRRCLSLENDENTDHFYDCVFDGKIFRVREAERIMAFRDNQHETQKDNPDQIRIKKAIDGLKQSIELLYAQVKKLACGFRKIGTFQQRNLRSQIKDLEEKRKSMGVVLMELQLMLPYDPEFVHETEDFEDFRFSKN
ncbi:hypothetical protein A2645_01175 [Candidatus Nomurabacteria bacterium RIFCSPHIGHO2_01_FULL_39_9]|uniref:Uncharacterized protein n=1 Tax=Candidatus Nomurabacteria bacterium RIFCSPHIGHO2_01_FULL_39_9 TaxID=1801735 RepID=A0A1F6UWP5_9BACT|nr:MAG: hypothetical protein A2645_01175 [Candidatus Nomurabacteria bacterium RIFCSPHIGHO2_01_FULL_39_9]